MHASDAIENAPGFVEFPDYKIIVEKTDRLLTARLGGEVMAESNAALILRESNHVPVVYFPPADVHMEKASQTDKESFCPFKGTATYWSFGTEANVAWSYETPFREMQEIQGYLAFYADRLDEPVL